MLISINHTMKIAKIDSKAVGIKPLGKKGFI